MIMLGHEKLDAARVHLEDALGSNVMMLFFDDELIRLRAVLQDETSIIIYYNDHDQYSYSIIFSEKKEDRCRFDNFDKNWKVKTAPHHFHPRWTLEAFESPFLGDPDSDISGLCDLILKGKMLDSEYRFSEPSGQE